MCFSIQSQMAQDGRKDGDKGVPDWNDTEHAPAVASLARDSQEKISGIEKRFDKADKKHYRAFTLHRAHYQQAVERHDEAQKQYDEAVKQFEQDHGRKPVGIHTINPIAYWGGMLLVIFLIEFPLGLSSFQLLQQIPAVTALIAFGASLLIAFLAHFAASWITHPRPYKMQQISGLVFLLIIVPITLFGLSYFREIWLHQQGKTNEIPIEVNLMTGTIIFWLFSLIAYGAGICWGIREQDPISMAFTDLRNAKRKLAQAETKFQLAYQARIKNAYYFHSCVLQKFNRCLSVIEIYNKENLRQRYANTQPAPKGRPESFKSYPYIRIPEHLSDPANDLDWR